MFGNSQIIKVEILEKLIEDRLSDLRKRLQVPKYYKTRKLWHKAWAEQNALEEMLKEIQLWKNY